MLFIQHCPLIYYAYAGFPVFFWEEVIANRETLKEGIKVLMQGDGKRVSSTTIASQAVLYFCILESLVWHLHPRLITGLRIFPSTCIQYLLYFGSAMAVYIWRKLLEEEHLSHRRMDYFLPGHELIHAIACGKAGKSSIDV